MAEVRDPAGRRGTITGSSARSNFPRLPIKLENSYRLEPAKRVPQSSLIKIIKETFESMLASKGYDETECPKLVKLLSDMIKDQAKALGFPRYKIITTVALGQSSQSTIICGSRFIWNEATDTFAEHIYTNSKLYAVGTIFAVYVD